MPEPVYKEEMGGFSVYFYKDIYTDESLKKIGLSERQIKAVMYVKERGKITNKEYRELVQISDEGARRDMSNLIEKGLFVVQGKGRNTFYILK